MQNEELVLLAALRYALPRHTYICKTVSDYIIEKMKDLSTNCIIAMKLEIEDELKETEMWECDKSTFRELLDKLKTEECSRVLNPII